MGKYAVSNPGDKQAKRSVGDATSYAAGGETVKDDMNGGNTEAQRPYLRMSEGNILEAKGRDVSNNSVTDSGWGGEEPAYKGMAIDAPYGMGAGMKGKAGDN